MSKLRINWGVSIQVQCAEHVNSQVAEAQYIQFVLRTKYIGRVRLISSTTQTCILKRIMVFFEVAYKLTIPLDVINVDVI